MKHARFHIQIEEKADWGADGKDKVEFLISANAGEPLKPLAKIASGGEMSRVMLALKTVLVDAARPLPATSWGMPLRNYRKRRNMMRLCLPWRMHWRMAMLPWRTARGN